MKIRLNIFSGIRIEHLWAIAVLVGIFMFLNTHPIRPHDFWWHMAVGRDTWETGQIPTVDTYSFTRFGEQYWSYHQFWLTEVILYLIFNAGGPVFVVLAQTAMIFPAYVILLLIGYRLTQNWRAAALSLVFAFALGFGNWNVRPQAISYLLGSLVLVSIYRYKSTRNKAWLVMIPIVMVVWINSHGSFPIGLALVGIWVADESWSAFVTGLRLRNWQVKSIIPPYLTLLFAIGGCFVNPRGIGFVSYLSSMTGNAIIQNLILEWKPPSFDTLEGLIFFVMFLGSAVLLAVSPRRPDLYQILTFLVFGVLGLKYIRGIIWYGITMAPIVAYHLSAVLDQLGIQEISTPTPRNKMINRLFAIILLFLAFLSLPWFKNLWPVIPEKAGIIDVGTPVQATQFMLENDLLPRIYHDMAFGSYLIWAAQPKYKVFVDSRIELYTPEIWNDYFTIGNALYGWDDLLKKYRINTLMVSMEYQPRLINAVTESPDWKLVYEDTSAIIFTRLDMVP